MNPRPFIRNTFNERKRISKIPAFNPDKDYLDQATQDFLNKGNKITRLTVGGEKEAENT